MMGVSLRIGDWVKADTDIIVSMLATTTIQAGTRGVVIGVSAGWLRARAKVAFDNGFGMVRATVPSHQLRLVRRDGGVDRFTRRQGRLAAARFALALFLAWPTIWWSVQYVWINQTFAGITGAFAISALTSASDWITVLIANPVNGLIYMGFLWILGRLAWR